MNLLLLMRNLKLVLRNSEYDAGVGAENSNTGLLLVPDQLPAFAGRLLLPP